MWFEFERRIHRNMQTTSIRNRLEQIYTVEAKVTRCGRVNQWNDVTGDWCMCDSERSTISHK